MMIKTELPQTLLQQLPLEKGVNPIFPASTISLRRNLASPLFPSKCTPQELEQIALDIQDALQEAHYLALPSQRLTPLDKEFLFEHFLWVEKVQNPSLFLLDPLSHLLILINGSDHLQFHLLNSQEEIEARYATIAEIEKKIATLGFAFSPQFGHLTSQPEYSGTGLTITNYLHLPALIQTGSIQEILDKQQSEETTVSSMEGDKNFVGNLLLLRNRYRQGVTEESILRVLQETRERLMLSEEAMRTKLKIAPSPEIQDAIYRAYGILMNSYQLETRETLSLLSMIQLGLELGLLTGVPKNKPIELFFTCRKAHLTYHLLPKYIPLHELSHKRAEYIHNELRELKALFN